MPVGKASPGLFGADGDPNARTPRDPSHSISAILYEEGIAKQIDTGMFHVNDGTVHDEPLVPFGGEKHSGVGRLNGDTAVDAFTTQKWISVQHKRSFFPF